jgi:histone H3/H4
MPKTAKSEQKKVPLKNSDASTGEVKAAKQKRSKARPSGSVAAKRIREYDHSKMPIPFGTFSKRARKLTDEIVSSMFPGEVDGKVHFGDVFMHCLHQLVCQEHIKETRLAKQLMEHAKRKIFTATDYKRFQVIRKGLAQ